MHCLGRLALSYIKILGTFLSLCFTILLWISFKADTGFPGAGNLNVQENNLSTFMNFFSGSNSSC